MSREVRSTEDVLRLLDGMVAPGIRGGGLDGFYADRDVPFAADKPDENLVAWIEGGLIPPGRALDVGCGPGRNARYLAAQGFDVYAVDISATAIDSAAGAAAGGESTRSRRPGRTRRGGTPRRCSRSGTAHRRPQPPCLLFGKSTLRTALFRARGRRAREDRATVLRGLLTIYDQRHDLVDALWEATDPQVAVQQVLGVSELQARAVLDLQLRRLTPWQRDLLREELEQLEE
ncbi:methyltransferase domain-containing protein [Amycolatopsis thermoflava]|uniref:class I SAM-dependent methyltransferase n=1 Tax=Amycolatopsis thermoflava TaxID=84480 RepID=UPI003EB90F76